VDKTSSRLGVIKWLCFLVSTMTDFPQIHCKALPNKHLTLTPSSMKMALFGKKTIFHSPRYFADKGEKMSKLLSELNSGKILLADGAMGTSLQQLGLESGQCPESWNVTHPAEVEQVIAAYAAAGSDLVETNSFGGTSYKLRHYGLADQVSELNQKAAQIARQAVGDNVLVVGSVGPTGALMKPLGPASREEIYQAFKEQIVALAAGGVDAICIETMMALDEATTALQAARENCDLPVIVTFTFEKTPKGEYRTLMGDQPEQIASRLTDAGADIVGSNCGGGIEQMVDICSQMRASTDRFIMIQANAGLPVLEDGQAVYKATPDDMAAQLGALLAGGANIIGGCCGTTPGHIRAFRQYLDQRK
jgi:5-methyltetrahydrofolate--homocysteine methyltransferase